MSDLSLDDTNFTSGPTDLNGDDDFGANDYGESGYMLAVSSALAPGNVHGILAAGSGTGSGLIANAGNFNEGDAAAIVGMTRSAAYIYPTYVAGVLGVGGNNTGVHGDSSGGIGVIGESTTNSGVTGYSSSGQGVYGRSYFTNGVGGDSTNGFGVYGASESSHGVVGINWQPERPKEPRPDEPPIGAGVVGQTYFGIGVYGGVRDSQRGQYPSAKAGVFHGPVEVDNPIGHGVHATTEATAAATGGYAAVIGETQGDSDVAIAGFTKNPRSFAGYFIGSVVVDGSFTVVNPVNKHAAMPHPDGTHRLLYSVESPESWLEDFGEAELEDGEAEVRLDADFAAMVRTGTDHYHVFLTPYGDSRGLYVAARHEDRFVVREQQGGKGSLAFSYRLVAKPRGVEAERLAPFTMPALATAGSEGVPARVVPRPHALVADLPARPEPPAKAERRAAPRPRTDREKR